MPIFVTRMGSKTGISVRSKQNSSIEFDERIHKYPVIWLKINGPGYGTTCIKVEFPPSEIPKMLKAMLLAFREETIAAFRHAVISLISVHKRGA